MFGTKMLGYVHTIRKGRLKYDLIIIIGQRVGRPIDPK